ncbi:COP9 signalosome complex subunit 1B [Entamoeba marina]
MTDYILGYTKYGRMLRYYNIINSESIAPPEIIAAANDYSQELNNIGAFAKLKDLLSSQFPLDEPKWKKDTAFKLFDTVKNLEAEITSTYGDDDKANLLLKLAHIHEEHGEYGKAIKNILTAVDGLKNKNICADGYYHLIRLNIFIDNFHQASNFLEKLQSLSPFTGNLYTKFCYFISFLLNIRSSDTFSAAFEVLENVITFEEEDKWSFNEFLSFRDIAIFGTLVGLLTQNHQVNVVRLINNSKFRNHADTIPELVKLLDDYKENKFSLISSDVKRLEKYMKYNLYFGQNLSSVVSTIKQRCYKEYIFSYSVVDMNLMAKMFGEPLQAVESALEDFIYSEQIKAKIDATTHTLHFVQGDERYNAYNNVITAVNKAIDLSQEIVLKSDAMFDY